VVVVQVVWAWRRYAIAQVQVRLLMLRRVSSTGVCEVEGGRCGTEKIGPVAVSVTRG